MKALVAYDGSLNAKKALEYGIRKVKEAAGELIVLHVFNSARFIDYDGGPGAERIARIESARHVEEARRILEKAGDMKASLIVEEGNALDEVIRLAKTENVDIIFCPPGYKSLVKDSPCPVAIVPGHILVPVDKTDVPAAAVERITEEARATGSRVILLGVVPIHIYTKWEKRELEKVNRETSALIKRLRIQLNERQIDTKEMIRSGYPDEEILKVADENTISMIIISAGGDEPSELSKAAAILSDRELAGTNNPLLLVNPVP